MIKTCSFPVFFTEWYKGRWLSFNHLILLKFSGKFWCFCLFFYRKFMNISFHSSIFLFVIWIFCSIFLPKATSMLLYVNCCTVFRPNWSCNLVSIILWLSVLFVEKLEKTFCKLQTDLLILRLARSYNFENM